MLFGLLMASVAHAENITIDNQSNKKIYAIQHASEILGKVKEMTGLDVDLGELKIIVLPTRGDLIIKYRAIYRHPWTAVISFYDPNTNIIFTYSGISSHILAHEFTHALVDKYYGKRSPDKINEVIPHWVEQNIDLNW